MHFILECRGRPQKTKNKTETSTPYHFSRLTATQLESNEEVGLLLSWYAASAHGACGFKWPFDSSRQTYKEAALCRAYTHRFSRPVCRPTSPPFPRFKNIVREHRTECTRSFFPIFPDEVFCFPANHGNLVTFDSALDLLRHMLTS